MRLFVFPCLSLHFFNLHGVQGVECSNHSVPTNKINGLAVMSS